MRKPLIAIVALGFAAACQDSPSEVPLTATPALEAAADHDKNFVPQPRTYEVTITNLTGGQPFTPPVAITHNRRFDAFSLGRPASFEVKEIAENGNVQPLIDLATADGNVAEVFLAGGSPPPILPGTSRTFTIGTMDGKPWISFVSMLICTNDGFTGLDRRRLPDPVGSTRTWYAQAYDAGTEINTEDFNDLVPPCPALTGVPTMKPGAGMSNPALAENGRVRRHPNVQGVADLDVALHGWTDGVAKITVRRID